jgi:crossover junction endodeoxyribonuclease RuvC
VPNVGIASNKMPDVGIASNKMRILGIDCGSARTGYGVIESDGRDHRMLVSGVICTNTRWPFEKRLMEIAGELRRVMREQAPEFAAVEEVFHAVNAKTALKLAHVRGVVLLTVAEAGIELAEYSPLEVKVNVVGYGRAEKCQVQLMVQSVLGLREAIASEDAADALAVALCHATHEATRRMLA